ncbi:hypothetical protein JCM10213_007540 [Rhodosporidiobolus nylandii]
MNVCLHETRDLLLKYRKDQPPPLRLEELARTLEEAQPADGPLPSSAAHLPQELLLIVAELVKPSPSLSGDEDDFEAEAALAKQQHLQHLPSLLTLALRLLPLLPTPIDPPSREECHLRAGLLLVFGRFTQAAMSSAFTTLEATLATGLLTPAHVRLPLVRHLLSTSLPPFFKPHPKLNPSTGRVLSRPLGGDRGLQDWYEETEDDATGWRPQAGLGGVVQVVIEALQPGEVEDLWPFLLPPLLSYLDDFEQRNRIVGITLLDSLLDRVDASLLRRTGVGKVFEKSLDSCFSALSDPLSPDVLAHAHPVALKLLNLQHPPPSVMLSSSTSEEPRFTALSALLTSSVLHSWEFKGQHVSIERITARAIPPLLDALGSGTIRYLQVLVPHLCELLVASATAAGGTWSLETAKMMCEAAIALERVVKHGKLRIKRWEGKIVGAVAQVWVGMEESDGAKNLAQGPGGAEALENLREALQGLMATLIAAGDAGDAGDAEEPAFPARLRDMGPIFSGLIPLQESEAMAV